MAAIAPELPTVVAPPDGELSDTELVPGKLYKAFYTQPRPAIWKYVKFRGYLGTSGNMLRFITYQQDNTESGIAINKKNVRIYPLTKSIEGVMFKGGYPDPTEMIQQLNADAWNRRRNAVMSHYYANENYRNNRRKSNRKSNRKSKRLTRRLRRTIQV